MSIKLIKTNLETLNFTESGVSEIQDFINQTKKLILINENINVDEIKNELTRKITSLTIIGDYSPSFLFPQDDLSNPTLSLNILVQQLDDLQDFLKKYSFTIFIKRQEIASSFLLDICEEIEHLLVVLKDIYLGKSLPRNQIVEDSSLPRLKEKISEIKLCLGKNISQVEKWGYLNRHLFYGEIGDLDDIVNYDWSSVKKSILRDFFQLRDIPSLEDKSISELRELVKHEVNLNKFDWRNISPEEFERLIFQLVSSPDITYENAEFLMKTNAPDRGRDISVYRIFQDSYYGSIRYRVIIQCKHQLSGSLSIKDISYLKDQIKSWEPPRVDILIIATTGHFSADAVKHIEDHNQSPSPLRIEMWSIEKIRNILDARPYLLAKFRI